MQVDLSTRIEINDNPNPRYNEQLTNEWKLRDEAKQILTAQLFNLALAFSINHDTEPIKKFANYFSTSIIHEPRPIANKEAIDDAKMLVSDYLMEQIIEAIIEELDLDEIEFSDTLHEVITDQYYSRDEAIRVLDELYEYEETDAGLWEGQGWETILSTKAAYTYSNAVYDHVRNMIEEMEDIDINEIEYDIAVQWMLDSTDKTISEVTHEMDGDDVIEHVKDHESEFDDMVKQEITKQMKKVIEEY